MQVSQSTPATDEKPSRPWLRGLFSGAVFGGLGAAAMHWLSFHSHAPHERANAVLGRKWMTGVTGVASGAVAMYGTMRADDEPPRSVFPETDDTKPDHHILTKSVQRESMIPSPGQRSL